MSQITNLIDSDYLTYQQLQHPTILQGGIGLYNASLHAMTDIVASCSYQNKPWVVAEFADGSRWAYYDGQLVGAFRNGVVLAGLTAVADVAEHIKDALSVIGELTITQTLGEVDIQAPAGTTLTIEQAKTSTSGVLRRIDASAGVAGTAGKNSIGQLLVMHAQTGGVVNNIYVGNDVDGWQKVMATNAVTAAAATSAASIADAIATAVNAYESNAPYVTATVTERTVFLLAPADTGDNFNGYKIKVEVTGPIVFSDCGFLITGAAGNKLTDLVDGSAASLISADVTHPGTTDAAWAQLIVDNINAYSATSGYVAAAWATGAGGLFIVSKKTTITDDATLQITATTDAGTCVLSDTPTSVPEEPPLVVNLIGGQYVGLPCFGANGGANLIWQGTQDNTIYATANGGTGTYEGHLRKVSGGANIYWDEDSPWYQPRFVAAGRIPNVPGEAIAYFVVVVEDKQVDGQPPIPAKGESVVIQVVAYDE